MEEVVESLKNDHDVAVQLPTGSGKSFIYIPLALAAVAKGYRVCILAPTNLVVDQVTKEFLPYFQVDKDPLIVKGIKNYQCLYTNCKADYAICTPDMRSAGTNQYPRYEKTYKDLTRLLKRRLPEFVFI